MDSALIDFLKKDYPAHFGQEWKEDTMQVRREQRPKGKFEIRDGQLQIVQYTGNGVSVINNNSETDVEIIDFEHYINIFCVCQFSFLFFPCFGRSERHDVLFFAFSQLIEYDEIISGYRIDDKVTFTSHTGICIAKAWRNNVWTAH